MIHLPSQLDSNRCPHCGVDRPFLYLAREAFATHNYQGGRERHWGVYACRRCGGVVTAWWPALGSASPEEVYPGPPEVDEAVPERAKVYLTQAMNTLSAPAGAIMLTASAVDAMLKHKGYKDGNLKARIDQAASAHLITDEMARWAHEVRLDANDQRHADDEAELPTEDDARRALEFAMTLSMLMFALPARVKRGIEDAKPSTT